MNVKQIHELITTGEIDKAKEIFQVNFDVEVIKKALKQYDPKQHDVHDIYKRKDKKLENGTFSPVTRISFPIQQKIVLTASVMLGTPLMDCTPGNDEEKKMKEALEAVSEDNKLDYRFKQIAKRVMSEMECAELWYLDTVKNKLRHRLLHFNYDMATRTGGDSLYPVFDVYGDMIAFGRAFGGKEQGKDVEYFDVYTSDYFYYFKRSEGTGWSFYDLPVINAEGNETTITGPIKNPWGKIPVIYGLQENPEWYAVQEAIDRIEKKVSNHADTNDRFDSPILFTEGEVEGFAVEKDDTGKLLEGREGAKASYLTWDNAPASMKMEVDNLLTFIHEFTHTPRLTFETVANKGIELSGVALSMLFLDAHMKAADKESMFGEFVQRRINFLKTALTVIDPSLKPALEMKIKPKFEYFLPKNIPEVINTLVTAVTGGIMSKESAVKQNPLIEDREAEFDLVKAEQEAAQQAQGLDAVMNE